MEYPTNLLPQLNYIHCIDLSKLCTAIDNIVIVRRSNLEKQDTFDDIGILTTGSLYENEREIPHLSFNILGGEFSEADIKWRQTGKNFNNWLGEKVELRDLEMENIEALDTTKLCPIFFSLNDLLRLEIPFEREIDTTGKSQKEFANKELDKNTHTYVTVVQKASSTNKTQTSLVITYSGGVVVTHVPTISNYWHVELNITEDSKKNHILDPIKTYSSVKPNIHYTTKAALSFFQRIKSIAKQTNDEPISIINQAFFVNK